MQNFAISPNESKLTKLEEIKPSKGLKVFFALLYVVFGFDFGFVKIKSRKISFCTRFIIFLYSFGVSVICFIYFCLDLDVILNMWNSFQLCSYFIPVIIFLSSENTLFVLQKELSLIESELRVHSVPNSALIKLALVVLSITLFRITLSPLYCYFYPNFCIRNLFISVMFIIPLAGTEILVTVYHFLFYLLYCHLVQFTDHIEVSRKPIIFYRNLYKFMMDSAEKCMETYGNMFSAVLLFVTPSTMLAVYIALKEMQIKNGEESDVKWMGYFENLVSLFLVISPVVSAGKLSAQTEKLKVVLHDRLLKVTDKEEIHNIERFIRYVEVRPFRFTVLKVLTVDWSLPVVIINLLVTYLIVIIQFTHIELV